MNVVKMSKIAILLMFIFAVIVVSAKDNEFVERQVNKLQKELNLTDEQTEQVEAIMTSTKKEMQKLHESASVDRRQMREQMRTLMEKQDKQIEELLTEEQKKMYQEVKKERREEIRKRRPGGKGEPGRW